MRIFDQERIGLLVPLFSLRRDVGHPLSGSDFGVGEYPDLAEFAARVRPYGVTAILTLPLLEPSPGQDSPYSACTFFGLDPLYIRLDDVEEWQSLADKLSPDEERARQQAAHAPRVQHDVVRPLKRRALHRCFAAFERGSAARKTACANFLTQQHAWLHPFAIYRALKDKYATHPNTWPETLRAPNDAALAEARAHHALSYEEVVYLEWLAFEQLRSAKSRCNELGVAVGGDEPFLVGDDSADVWMQSNWYRYDATVGAPPDAFSADGQEWGLPPYAWDAVRESSYELFHARAKHAHTLFDFVRLDHVVGLYRTYHRPKNGASHYFYPSDENAQLAQGEAVIAAYQGAGLDVVAEDLGVIPPFVRDSLLRLSVPGYRVARWDEEHNVFRDRKTWPRMSVATSGTHDTETSLMWWNNLVDWQRDAFLRQANESFPRDGRDPLLVTQAIMEHVLSAPSILKLFPIQDVLGLWDRINIPNTVGPFNWSWRLPRAWDEQRLAELQKS